MLLHVFVTPLVASVGKTDLPEFFPLPEKFRGDGLSDEVK